MLDVRIDTVKIFTTNSTYHCEMHFGTTVAYRRVNLRCSTFASEGVDLYHNESIAIRKQTVYDARLRMHAHAHYRFLK